MVVTAHVDEHFDEEEDMHDMDNGTDEDWGQPVQAITGQTEQSLQPDLPLPTGQDEISIQHYQVGKNAEFTAYALQTFEALGWPSFHYSGEWVRGKDAITWWINGLWGERFRTLDAILTDLIYKSRARQRQLTEGLR